MTTACGSVFNDIPFLDILEGVKGGYTGQLISKHHSYYSAMDVTYLSWTLFKMQRAFCSLGITVARSIAYTLIGVNVAVLAIDKITYSGKWDDNGTIPDLMNTLRSWIDPDVKHNQNRPVDDSRFLVKGLYVIQDKTSVAVFAANILKGVLDLGQNKARALAHLITIEILFFREDGDYTFIDHLGRCAQIASIYQTYAASIVNIYSTGLSGIYSMGLRKIFQVAFQKLCSMKAMEALSTTYETVKMRGISKDGDY